MRTREEIIEEINFAIKASNMDDSYTVGFRNGLRYAKYLIDGKSLVYEHEQEEEHESK